MRRKNIVAALAVPTNPLPGHTSKIYTALAIKMSGRDAESNALYRALSRNTKTSPLRS